MSHIPKKHNMHDVAVAHQRYSEIFQLRSQIRQKSETVGLGHEDIRLDKELFLEKRELEETYGLDVLSP